MSDISATSHESQTRYYRPSGRFSPFGLGAGALASMLAGAFLAVAYAYVDANCPFIYLNLILCFIFGVLIARINAVVARTFKCRNNSMLTVATAASALFSYYIAWAAWINAIIGRNSKASAPGIWAFANQPGEMWEYIQAIHEIGTWSISKDPINGKMLLAVWICEFILFLASAIWYIRSTGNEPFCEECENWCVRYPLSLKFRVIPEMDSVEFFNRIKAGEFEIFLTAGWPNASDAMFYEATLEYCNRCGRTHVLTIDRIITGFRNGKSAYNKTTLIKHMLLSQEDFGRIQRIFTDMLMEKGVEAPEFRAKNAAF